MLNNRLYNILKFLALVVIPGLVLFFTTLTDTWGWGDVGIKVAATISAIGLLLGGILERSSSVYNKGIITGGYLESTGRNEDTGHPDLRLTVTKDPNEIVNARMVQLKVGTPPPPPRIQDLEGE